MTYLPREISPLVQEALASLPVVVVTGLRQAAQELPRRGEVWWAREGKRRPALVLQTDAVREPRVRSRPPSSAGDCPECRRPRRSAWAPQRLVNGSGHHE